MSVRLESHLRRYLRREEDGNYDGPYCSCNESTERTAAAYTGPNARREGTGRSQKRDL
jgi:hypothetical protein